MSTSERTTIDNDREIKRLRKNLHYAITNRVHEFGWVVTDELVKDIKSFFLWFEFKVETSRDKRLDTFTLRTAIKRVKVFEKHLACAHLEKNNPHINFNDIDLRTQRQRNKLIRLMRYVLKMSWQRQLSYIEETIKRKDTIENISITEANELIRRLEKWEAKELIKK